MEELVMLAPYRAKIGRMHQDVEGTPSLPTYTFLLITKSFQSGNIMYEIIHTSTNLFSSFELL